MTSYVIHEGRAHISWDDNVPGRSFTVTELEDEIGVLMDAARALEVSLAPRSAA